MQSYELPFREIHRCTQSFENIQIYINNMVILAQKMLEAQSVMTRIGKTTESKKQS